jgi:putative acetyltransferase
MCKDEGEHHLFIRAYRNDDAQAVRRLFERVNRELAPPEFRERFEQYISIALRDEIDRIPDYYGSRPGCGFWIAEDPTSGLVGFFGLESDGEDSSELRRMYVAPERRRRGVARAMLAEAERLSASGGRRRIVLSTSELQPAALSLYRGAGYRLVKEESASEATHKTVGGGIRRFYFEKILVNEACNGENPHGAGRRAPSRRCCG